MLFSVLLLMTLATSSIASSGTSADSVCYDYVLISTRGTGEPQGPSIGFRGMIAETLSTVPNGVEYDTVYLAAPASERQGAADVVRFIDEGLIACPNQTYALFGYSQGASVTAIALQKYADPNSAGYKAIRSVVLIGNPVHERGWSANVDENNGTATRNYQGILNDFPGVLYPPLSSVPVTWYRSGKLVDICYTNDIVCVGINHYSVLDLFASHLKYGFSESVQSIGAQFVIQRLS